MPARKIDWSQIISGDLREELIRLYWKEERSIEEMDRKLGVSTFCIIKKMKELGIPRRPAVKRDRTSIHKRIMSLKGWERMTYKELSEMFDCSTATVNRCRTEFNRKRREK